MKTLLMSSIQNKNFDHKKYAKIIQWTYYNNNDYSHPIWRRKPSAQNLNQEARRPTKGRQGAQNPYPTQGDTTTRNHQYTHNGQHYNRINIHQYMAILNRQYHSHQLYYDVIHILHSQAKLIYKTRQFTIILAIKSNNMYVYGMHKNNVVAELFQQGHSEACMEQVITITCLRTITTRE